jgi:hypothetical protein
MRDKNLFAYTAPTPASGYPEYISVNLVEGGTKVAISVRSPDKDGVCGATAEIRLTLSQYESFRRRLA